MFTIVIYNITFGFILIFSYLAEYASSNAQRQLSRSFVFLTMFIPAAIRYDIGTDYSFYVDAYNSLGLLDNFEFGFKMIVICLKKLSLPTQSLFIFTSFIIYAPICFFLNRERYFLKIVLYFLIFYLYTFNIIRNSIALSILLVALELYLKGHKLKAYVIYSISCVFHYSMFFFIPIFILDLFYIKKRILLIISITFFYLIISNKIFTVLNTPFFLDSKYGVYIGSSHSNQTDIGSGLGVLLYSIIPIILLGILYTYYNSKTKIRFYMLLFYLFSYLLALKISILGRLSDVFSISLIFTLPYLIDKISKKRAHLAYFGFIFYFLLFILFEMQIVNNKRNNISGGHGINPYETIMF